MDAEEYRALRERCFSDYDDWKQLADGVADSLRTAMKRCGMECDLASRAKDPDSLLRKMVLKYNSSDLSRARDRAGVRVVVHLPSDLPGVLQLVRDTFPDHDEEVVSNRYKADQFDYRGVHFDVRLTNSPVSSSLDRATCEIQVRTVAEHAWSVLSHLLTYKSPGDDTIPREMKRRMHRLVALVELFDQEAIETQAQIMSRPEYAVQRLVFDLDRVHAQTVGDLTSTLMKSDPDLVDPLSHAYAPEEDPSEILAAFVNTNRDRLRRTVENNGLLSPLITLPEAILVWERLDYDVVAARAAWEETGLPISYLEDLATVWGVDLPDL